MTDCILVKSWLSSNGYGQSYYNGKNMKAHRAAWIRAYGPVPDGMVIDHICHTEAVQNNLCEGGVTCKHRACVNLDHLRLITQRENIRCGKKGFDNILHCPKGHPYIKENIMTRKDGRRECAECNRIRARANWAKKRVNA
jgi:hypothetical protein